MPNAYLYLLPSRRRQEALERSPVMLRPGHLYPGTLLQNNSPKRSRMIHERATKAIQQALAMLEEGTPQHKILVHLIEAAEHLAGPGAVCSILLLDKQGLLRNGCSPQLPYDYLTAIDGLKPHPGVGTCAAAAATGEVVMTPDFKSDDKWSELRHLPLALGFTGAWSMPIKTTGGAVLGTFGTYYRQGREPSELEVDSVQQLADTAARVLG
jgi:GAF domain-containing protein